MIIQSLHISGVLLLLAVFTGCEQTLDINELQEEEKLVVCGGVYVTPDSLFTHFWFQRTGSLGEAYRGKDMIVSNVDLKLRGGERDIPLVWNDGILHSQWRWHELLTARRRAATGGRTDFTLTFHWKDAIIPVELKAPLSPVELLHAGFENLVVENQEVFSLTTAYPKQTGKEHVFIELQFWNDSNQSWRYLGSFTPDIRYVLHTREQRSATHGNIVYDTLRYYDTGVTANRVRYRIYIQDAVLARARTAFATEIKRYTRDELHPVFRPTGSNPDFNVRGRGIGYVWYERVGPWIEIP